MVGRSSRAVGLQLGREIARLPATVRHRLDQRTLLAADVAAGADENGDRKGAPKRGGIVAAKTQLLGAPDRLATGLNLLGVFMADVDESLGGLGDQPRNDHAFDHGMRHLQKDLAILERARLAFIAVDNDEAAAIAPTAAGAANGIADVAQFLDGGNARAAHAAQIGVLEFL